ncbi:MAG: molybdate ABC transporter substrate-binding protein [Comamonas sp.]|nr:molybdate ABC transporter substrate-binding protein [Comamonas sp.]
MTCLIPLRVALSLVTGLAGAAQADTVAVAVASNFTAPMQKIAAAFAKDTGHQAQLSFGASGKLYAQISHGAPFGVLLSGDDKAPAKIAAEGKGDASSRFTYAQGQLVLWSPQAGYVDPQGHILKKSGWTHLAIANPKLAPYGTAAEQTLATLGVLAQVRPKLVQGENIGQTYQFVATGNAQLGFVALSQVMANGQIPSGSAWVVPAAMHAPIRQDAIVLNSAKDNPAARALVQYLQSDKARSIIAGYGYSF